MKNYILTTCKRRCEHLRIALTSWRMFMPQWVPIVVAVDEPAAFDVTKEVMSDNLWLGVPDSYPDGFSRLQHLDAGMRELPSDADLVAILDCDIVALLGTHEALTAPFSGFCVADCLTTVAIPHDAGVLWTKAEVLREAFDLIRPGISDWVGYGWEDMLIRAACWLVTSGRIDKRRIMWAHIPHSNEVRTVSNPSDLVAQARDNYGRFMRDIRSMCSKRGAVAARELMLKEILIYPSK